MMLPLRYYGDPVLREKADAVVEIDDAIRRLALDMIETMHAERGVGLAAQQVGRTVALCAVAVPAEMDVDDDGVREHPDHAMPMVLINPSIIEVSEDAWSTEEGCLSFPGISAMIRRPCGITVEFTRLDGTEVRTELTGYLSRVVQHEVDHLNGILFNDHMTPVKKAALSGRLKRLRKETLARLETA